jgi:choline dehydrogenase-like flavoprotein
MFIDARRIANGAEVQADVAIAGAGAAGITLALELSGKGLSVCLLESGGTDFAWADQALYTGRGIGLPHCALDVCQLRYLGGNTNAWGGWCRPLDPMDFEPRAWVEQSGWPFSIGELTPFYRRAHQICEVPSDDYDPERAAAELGHRRARPLALDPRCLETLIYRFSPPTRFGRVYRPRLHQARDIRCYLHANVLGIEADSSARRINRLSIGALSGARFSVAARHFVLAAGGIENARLLLLSTSVVAAGLGNEHDLVGRFFMDHPHTKRRVIVFKQRLDSGLYSELFLKRRIMGRMSLPEKLQRSERLLNYSANLHPVYFGHDSRGWIALSDVVRSCSHRSDPFLRSPPYDRKGVSLRQIVDMLRRLDRTAAAVLLRVFKPNRFINGLVLESKPEQAPNPDSRVTLDDRCDAFGLRRVKLDWRTLPLDRRTAVRGEEIIDAELRRLGIGSMAPLLPGEIEDWPENLESGWHQLGTTRMHADPRHGVVDANARVHGLSNLFIVGGSVFPTGGAAPPTLTIVALAVRLAAHLKNVSTHERQPGFVGQSLRAVQGCRPVGKAPL